MQSGLDDRFPENHVDPEIWGHSVAMVSREHQCSEVSIQSADKINLGESAKQLNEVILQRIQKCKTKAPWTIIK